MRFIERAPAGVGALVSREIATWTTIRDKMGHFACSCGQIGHLGHRAGSIFERWHGSQRGGT